MVVALSGSYSASLPRTNSTAVNSRTGQADSLLSRLQKTDPEKAEQLSNKLTEARNASDLLSAAKIDQNAERKAAALEKIQRIKEQLKALRMLGASDPKATAQQAARLSRELAAAVKEYAASNGGKAPDGISAANPPPSGTAQQAQGTQFQEAAPAEIANGDAVAQRGGPPAQTAEASPEAMAQTNGSDDPVEDGTSTAATTNAGPETPEEIREEEQEQREEESLSPARSGSADRTATSISLSDPNATFKELVRSVEDEIKKILEAAKSQLNQQEDRNLRRDIEDTEKSLGEIERVLSTLSGPVATFSAVPSTAHPAAPVNMLA